MSAFHFAKQFLRAMSDDTFLSSIDIVDFGNKIIHVKSKFWKSLIGFTISSFHLDSSWQKNIICSQIKRLFIERFSEVSANRIKDYLLTVISDGYINFKNMIYYMFNFYMNGNVYKNKNKVKQLRLHHHYEKKARKHYLHYVNSLHQTVDPEEEVIPPPEPEESDIISDFYESESDQFSPPSTPPPAPNMDDIRDNYQRMIDGLNPDHFDDVIQWNNMLDTLRRADVNYELDLDFSRLPEYASISEIHIPDENPEFIPVVSTNELETETFTDEQDVSPNPIVTIVDSEEIAEVRDGTFSTVTNLNVGYDAAGGFTASISSNTINTFDDLDDIRAFMRDRDYDYY